MPDLILVTGQHRSGTSATAGCLQLLGVELGDKLMPANSGNRKGYFEDTRVVKVHDRLLDKLGARWDRPQAIPTTWQEEPATKTAEAHLHGLLLSFQLKADLFAIKDPRACLFIPMWQRLCDLTGTRLTLLTTVRREEGVRASLSKREGWMPQQALEVVRGYQKALAALDPDIPRADIHFPFDLAEVATWERVADTLGVTLDTTQMGAVHSFLDGGLVHHG